eukprot:g1144.t1
MNQINSDDSLDGCAASHPICSLPDWVDSSIEVSVDLTVENDEIDAKKSEVEADDFWLRRAEALKRFDSPARGNTITEDSKNKKQSSSSERERNVATKHLSLAGKTILKAQDQLKLQVENLTAQLKKLGKYPVRTMDNAAVSPSKRVTPLDESDKEKGICHDKDTMIGEESRLIDLLAKLRLHIDSTAENIDVVYIGNSASFLAENTMDSMNRSRHSLDGSFLSNRNNTACDIIQAFSLSERRNSQSTIFTEVEKIASSFDTLVRNYAQREASLQRHWRKTVQNLYKRDMNGDTSFQSNTRERRQFLADVEKQNEERMERCREACRKAEEEAASQVRKAREEVRHLRRELRQERESSDLKLQSELRKQRVTFKQIQGQLEEELEQYRVKSRFYSNEHSNEHLKEIRVSNDITKIDSGIIGKKNKKDRDENIRGRLFELEKNLNTERIESAAAQSRHAEQIALMQQSNAELVKQMQEIAKASEQRHELQIEEIKRATAEKIKLANEEKGKMIQFAVHAQTKIDQLKTLQGLQDASNPSGIHVQSSLSDPPLESVSLLAADFGVDVETSLQIQKDEVCQSCLNGIELPTIGNSLSETDGRPSFPIARSGISLLEGSSASVSVSSEKNDGLLKIEKPLSCASKNDKLDYENILFDGEDADANLSLMLDQDLENNNKNIQNI